MTLLLNRSDVADLLPIEACIEAVEGAFKLHGEGRANPPGILGMRAKEGSQAGHGVKIDLAA
jgi:ornithine cyclodeaminase/alanine dehydrogenase-like protein (mu-crystallin family)